LKKLIQTRTLKNPFSQASLRQVIYTFGEKHELQDLPPGLLSQHRTALDFNLFDRHAKRGTARTKTPTTFLSR
jgi:hypothetical protein